MTKKMPRMVASYQFEGGDFVEIIASENVSTGVALDQAELIIRMKRFELEHGAEAAKVFLGGPRSPEEPSS